MDLVGRKRLQSDIVISGKLHYMCTKVSQKYTSAVKRSQGMEGLCNKDIWNGQRTNPAPLHVQSLLILVLQVVVGVLVPWCDYWVMCVVH